MSECSDKILKLIKEKNLSYMKFSEMTGIPKSALQRYATGETEKIPVDRLESIANALNVSAQYLLGWKGDEKKPTPDETQLTNKDKKQIENILENTRQQLLSQDGLMFEGSPASEEDVQKVLIALQMGMEMIKKENKEKYTPKKYRK